MATNDRYVSTNADLVVSRSRMGLRRRTPFSYFHGYLHPVGSPIEVLPGDTLKGKLSMFVRMSTPIVPFIDDVRAECDAFFVPKRILWNKTKQFYGEAPSFGIAAKVYEPMGTFVTPLANLSTNLLKSESFAAAFGLIYANATGNVSQKVNVLPIRAVLSCYNEYYRNQNYQDQYTWDKDATGNVGIISYLGASSVYETSLLPVVNKDRDVITSILPWSQKGDPVSIGLAGTAPVVGQPVKDASDLHDIGIYQFGYMNGTTPTFFPSNLALGTGNSGTAPDIYAGTLHSVSASGEGLSYAATLSNMVADLSQTTAVKINDLLYALAYQDFLARAAHFGTRYKEYIYSMFGTKIPDLSDDIPEYLGRMKFNINVQQVVQTTGFAASSSTELGSLGAYSNSGKSSDMFSKSFTEPGYLVILFYTKHQRTYSSGLDRVFLKSELLDYYQPPFANIPDLPFGSLNVWLDKSNETSLGFQEPWFDYRAFQDRVYGMMNPMIDTLGEIWTLAEKWTAKPTIAGAFMKEDRDCIARVLATGVNGPDYLVDAVLDLDATRVMPLYSSGTLEKF